MNDSNQFSWQNFWFISVFLEANYSHGLVTDKILDSDCSQGHMWPDVEANGKLLIFSQNTFLRIRPFTSPYCFYESYSYPSMYCACLCFVHLPNQNSCPTFHPQLQKRPSSLLQFCRYGPFVAVITFPVSDVQKQQPFSSQPASAKLRRAKKKMNRAGIFILRGFFSACCGNVDLNRTVSF